jgi:hypothetical protein
MPLSLPVIRFSALDFRELSRNTGNFFCFVGDLVKFSLQPRLNGRWSSLALTFLRKFPANREKYREFAEFCPLVFARNLSKLHVLLEKGAHSEQILTGNCQGHISDRGLCFGFGTWNLSGLIDKNHPGIET